MTTNLIPSVHAKSGFKYVIFDNRSQAKSKPWSVSAPNYRSKGFATAHEAAEHYSRKFHPDWWVKANVCDSEVERMNLFGIRLSMKFKKKWIDGTVVAYFPATKEHLVRFDDGKQSHFHMRSQKNWVRIPWPGNVLDPNSEMGETSDDSYISFGPDCPKCAAFLGVGAKAWTKCHMCSLNEPGACLWNLAAHF